MWTGEKGKCWHMTLRKVIFLELCKLLIRKNQVLRRRDIGSEILVTLVCEVLICMRS